MSEKISLDSSERKYKIFNRNNPGRCHFFQTNQTAIPGMQAIFDLGYDIPGQVSVVCFHDNEFFSLLKPSITVLCQPIEEMGKECAHILLQNMREEVQKSVKQVYLTSKLIVRESS